LAIFCQCKNIDLGKQDVSGAAQTHVWVCNQHFEALQKERKTLWKFWLPTIHSSGLLGERAIEVVHRH